MSLGFPLRPLIAALALTLAAGTAAAGDLTLSILHTNDFHSRIDPVTVDGSRCRTEDAEAHKCYGGIARIATELARLRASEPNPLALDAGDRFQGSLFYNYYKSAALKPFFELLRYDAMTLGNHEFDDGPAELARFLHGLTIPVISANVDASAEPALAGRFAGTRVVTVAGEPVGLVGLTTPSTTTNAKPGPNVHFGDPVVAARTAVEALHAQGVKRIILITHLGLADDEALAAQVDGIGVIVGGHSHTLLRNDDPRALDMSPKVVKSPSGQPVLIVQAYFAGVYLGFLQVTLDDAGTPRAWKGQPVLLDDSIPEDPTVRAFVEALAVPLQAQINQKIGEAAVDLDGGSAACRFGECNLGDVIADAMIEQTKTQGTQIALINGGGIRASIPTGVVTLGQVLEVLPFSNTISTFDLRGSDLRDALEYGVGRAEDPANSSAGRFPQVSGLRYTWDAAQPAGQRIVTVQIRQPDGSYTDLDNQAVYHAATIDFLRTGGDGYTVFRDKAIDPYDGGAVLSDAVAAFIAARSPVTTKAEGRISRLN